MTIIHVYGANQKTDTKLLPQGVNQVSVDVESGAEQFVIVAPKNNKQIRALMQLITQKLAQEALLKSVVAFHKQHMEPINLPTPTHVVFHIEAWEDDGEHGYNVVPIGLMKDNHYFDIGLIESSETGDYLVDKLPDNQSFFTNFIVDNVSDGVLFEDLFDNPTEGIHEIKLIKY